MTLMFLSSVLRISQSKSIPFLTFPYFTKSNEFQNSSSDLVSLCFGRIISDCLANEVLGGIESSGSLFASISCSTSELAFTSSGSTSQMILFHFLCFFTWFFFMYLSKSQAPDLILSSSEYTSVRILSIL